MNYQNISDDEFQEMILQIARENIDYTLSLPGVYEVISEEYNNEALDRIIEDKRERRKLKLMAVLKNIGKHGFLCYLDAPYI